MTLNRNTKPWSWSTISIISYFQRNIMDKWSFG